MKIVIDAMGGDNAPQAIVQGALDAHRELNAENLNVEIILVGRTADILRCVEASPEKELPAGVEIRDAQEVVEIADDPAFACRNKKKSSMTIGLQMVRDGQGDAFLSAGSTGALLAGATLIVRRIKDIHRAVIAPQVPCLGGHLLLCDAGANAECTPEFLLQFAFLGSFYMKRVMGVENPRTALLNIGAEEEKGDPLRKKTHALLKAAGDAGRINFIGNIEGTDAMLGGADVVVTDGFTGNVFLKTVEGSGKFLAKELKDMFLTSGKTKIAAALLQKNLDAFRKILDPAEIGATAFLGIRKPVLKAHGASDARAIVSAVRRAVEFVQSGFIQAVEENIDCMKLDEPKPPSAGPDRPESESEPET